MGAGNLGSPPAVYGMLSRLTVRRVCREASGDQLIIWLASSECLDTAKDSTQPTSQFPDVHHSDARLSVEFGTSHR